MDWKGLANRIRHFFSLTTTEELEQHKYLANEVHAVKQRIREAEEKGLTAATKLFVLKREEEIHFANTIHDQLIELFTRNGLQHCVQPPYPTKVIIKYEWPIEFRITIGWAGSSNVDGVIVTFTAYFEGANHWTLEYAASGPGANYYFKMLKPEPMENILNKPLESWFLKHLSGVKAYDPETNTTEGPLPKIENVTITPSPAVAPALDVPKLREEPKPLVQATVLDEETEAKLQTAAEGLMALGYNKTKVKKMLSKVTRNESPENMIREALATLTIK